MLKITNVPRCLHDALKAPSWTDTNEAWQMTVADKKLWFSFFGGVIIEHWRGTVFS